MDNNYYNYETPYYDTPNANKFENISNISQLPNYYIKQPNSNEFIIKCNNLFWLILLFFFGSSGFLALLICVLIFDFGEYTSGGVGFGICFLGFLACIGLYGCLSYTIRQKVILTEDQIQIKNYHILCCINSNKIYNYTDIQGFQVDIVKGKNNIRIIWYDNINEKECCFDHNFGLEEAQYFVYVVNGFIKKNKI